MRAVILSDTHGRTLPDDLWRAMTAADLVIHAGDWVSPDLLHAMPVPLLGVYGNNDGDAIRAVLPEVARATYEGVRVAVVHETGAATGRERRMDRAFPDTDLLVFGHSHVPWDTTTPNGLRLLNPGSPTVRRRQPHGTWVEATFADGQVDVEWREVTPGT
jgi:putative phosphoesterase